MLLFFPRKHFAPILLLGARNLQWLPMDMYHAGMVVITATTLFIINGRDIIFNAIAAITSTMYY
jgi:hypothetical protein